MKIHIETELMFVTESWLHDMVPDATICPNGYGVIRADRTSSRGGGVALLFKNSLKVIQVNLSNNGNYMCTFYDFISIDILFKSCKVRLCCFYIPPSLSCYINIIKDVCNVISYLSPKTYHFYVCDDFNLPNVDWLNLSSDGNPANDFFLEFCVSNCLIQCIHESTYVKGNILDLLLCNSNAKNCLLNICIDLPFSIICDHFLISFSINIKDKTQSTTVKKYQILDAETTQWAENGDQAAIDIKLS